MGNSKHMKQLLFTNSRVSWLYFAQAYRYVDTSLLSHCILTPTANRIGLIGVYLSRRGRLGWERMV